MHKRRLNRLRNNGYEKNQADVFEASVTRFPLTDLALLPNIPSSSSEQSF
jgi:hypothetical protein